MSNLTEFARDQPCQFRIPGVCLYDVAKTSPCHVRYANIAGGGQKPNDLALVHGCSACHDLIDGRNHTIQRAPESWEGIVLAGLLRTLCKVSDAFTVRKAN